MGRLASIALCLLFVVSCDDESGESTPPISADMGPVDAEADAAPAGDGAADPAPDAVPPADAAPMLPPDAAPMLPPAAAPMPLDPQADCMQQPSGVPPTLSEGQINDQRIIYSDTPTERGILFLFHLLSI